MHVIRNGALALGMLAALAGTARAATVLRLTFEELTARSDAVVRGRVVSSTPKLDSQKGRITTFTEVEVTESVKGAPAKKVTVRQPGGEVGGIGQSVAGAARFTPGEEVVLFLQRAPDEASVFQVLSMSAGKVRLEKKRSELRAVRDLDGIDFLDRPAQAQSRSPGGVTPGGVKVVSIEDLGDASRFLARLRAAARPAPAPAPSKKEAKP